MTLRALRIAALDPLDIARELLAQAYGLKGDLTRLGGENLNLLVDVPSGDRYVLKIQSREHDALSQLELSASAHVARLMPDLATPRAIPDTAGDAVVHAETPAASISARLLEYIDGVPWYEGGGASVETLCDLGRVLAEVDRALESFDHPAAHRTHGWDLTAAGQHRHKISAIDSPERRLLAERLFQHWAAAESRLASLPQSVIHGDVNDENVLVDGGAVIGLLDFGDALVNPTV